MSTYQHDLRKFSDAGLQLRLPVDLIPSGQYSILTNALPVIEGELRTREGVTEIAVLTNVVEVSVLSRATTGDTLASIATTIYPHGFTGFDNVTLIVIADSPTNLNQIVLGTYNITVINILSPLSFSFTAGIPASWNGTDLNAPVLAQATKTAGAPSTITNPLINTIYRLNQALPNLNGDRLASFLGRLFRASLPSGNQFTELVHPSVAGEPPSLPNGFSGRPLSIISFRFTDDTASWAIIADQNVMYKYRESGNATSPDLFLLLGNPIPTIPAIATAGATGNLNSSGGAQYDWRYTYYDGFVNTEGNPSASPTTGTPDSQSPTGTTNPDPNFNTGGAFPFTNSAFTGVTNTAGTGTATQSDFTTFHQTSCRWFGFTAPVTAPSSPTLTVEWQVTITKPSSNPAPVQGQLNYSTNGGASFTNFAAVTDVSSGTITSTVVLPSGVDYTQVQLQVWGFCNIDLLGHNTGNAITITVFDISIDGTITPVANQIDCINQEAIVCVAPPSSNDGRVTGIRLYRRGGSLPDAWRLVGTFSLSGLTQGSCGAGTLQIIDNISDTELSNEPILELDNDAPVTSVTVLNQPLSFIWGPAGQEARVLGCGDPNRPECVYFSKPGNPDAWPPNNFIEVSDPGTPIIAGCVYNTRNYAFSREGIYELVEGLGNGVTFTPFKTPSAHGLYTPWGLALGPAIFFLSKDGIYATTGGQETSIVENDIKPLFPTYDTPGQPVENYDAIDYSQPDSMRLVYYNDELWFVYVGLQTQQLQLLIYDLVKKRWRAAVYNRFIPTVYSEPATVSSLLLGTDIGTLDQAGGQSDPNATPIFVQLRTGAHDQGAPLNQKQYGNVIFDLDPGGANVANPITITPCINGEAVTEASLTVTGTGRQQVPLDLSDFFAFNVEFQITWNKFSLGGGTWSQPILYQYDILWFPEPAELTHWESQPSSLGMIGYLHVRDLYVAIRSQADVTLTLFFTVDGSSVPVTQTYDIPSTGGVRQKVYIQLDSNKGLLYNWSLDSTEGFRTYVEDTEVRAKSWLSVLGYTITKPFGAESAGASQ